MYAPRIAINMLLTFAKSTEVRSFDLPRVHRILKGWKGLNFFADELMEVKSASNIIRHTHSVSLSSSLASHSSLIVSHVHVLLFPFFDLSFS